jgi:hypothetical protein
VSETLSRRDLHDQVAYLDFEFGPETHRATWVVRMPVSIFVPDDGRTWRVLDQHGVVHVLPAPGYLGCVVRYEKVPGAEDPVEL